MDCKISYSFPLYIPLRYKSSSVPGSSRDPYKIMTFDRQLKARIFRVEKGQQGTNQEEKLEYLGRCLENDNEKKNSARQVFMDMRQISLLKLDQVVIEEGVLQKQERYLEEKAAHGIFVNSIAGKDAHARPRHIKGDKVWLNFEGSTSPSERDVSIINLRTCEADSVALTHICWYHSHADAQNTLWTLGGALRELVQERGRKQTWSCGVSQNLLTGVVAIGSVLLETYTDQPVATKLSPQEQKDYFEEQLEEMQEALLIDWRVESPSQPPPPPPPYPLAKVFKRNPTPKIKIREYDGLTQRNKPDPRARKRKLKPSSKRRSAEPIALEQLGCVTFRDLALSTPSLQSSPSESESNDSDSDQPVTPSTSSFKDYKPAFKLTGGSVLEDPDYNRKYAVLAASPYLSRLSFGPKSPAASLASSNSIIMSVLDSTGALGFSHQVETNNVSSCSLTDDHRASQKTEVNSIHLISQDCVCFSPFCPGQANLVASTSHFYSVPQTSCLGEDYYQDYCQGLDTGMSLLRSGCFRTSGVEVGNSSAMDSDLEPVTPANDSYQQGAYVPIFPESHGTATDTSISPDLVIAAPQENLLWQNTQELAAANANGLVDWSRVRGEKWLWIGGRASHVPVLGGVNEGRV